MNKLTFIHWLEAWKLRSLNNGIAILNKIMANVRIERQNYDYDIYKISARRKFEAIIFSALKMYLKEN